MLEMEELDSCRLSLPGSVSGDPRPPPLPPHVANLLAAFFLSATGVLVLCPVIRSKPLRSCSCLYWSRVSWKLTMLSRSASRTSSELLMMSGVTACSLALRPPSCRLRGGGVFMLMVALFRPGRSSWGRRDAASF